jgi:hypothetical protein
MRGKSPPFTDAKCPLLRGKKTGFKLLTREQRHKMRNLFSNNINNFELLMLTMLLNREQHKDN